MTRIASGQPDIWLDICAENRPAILSRARRADRAARRDARHRRHATTATPCSAAQRAREARTNLPSRVTQPERAGRGAHPDPRPHRAPRPRSSRWPPSWASTSPASRSSTCAESNVGVAVVLVDADVADLYRGGLHGPRLPPGRARRWPDGRRAAACATARHGRSTPWSTVPGSKSIANRALVVRRARRRRRASCAACPTVTTPRRWCDCLAALGVGVDLHDDGAVVAGTGGALRPRSAELHAASGRHDVALRHRPRRARRPAPVVDRRLPAVAAPADGARCTTRSAQLGVRRRRPREAWRASAGDRSADRCAAAGRSRCRGDVSSQYLTALMLIGPLLDGGLRIELTTPLVSGPYIELTAARDGGVRGRPASTSATTRSRVAARPVRRRRPRRRARRVVGELPAGRGRGRAAAGDGRRARPLPRQGDARVRRPAGAMGCDVERDRRGATTVRRDATLPRRHRRRHGRLSDLVPDARRRRRRPPRRRRRSAASGSSAARRATASATLPPSCATPACRSTSTADGLRIEPGATAARRAARHPPRPSPGDGLRRARHRGRRASRSTTPTSSTKSWPGFWAARDRLLDG